MTVEKRPRSSIASAGALVGILPTALPLTTILFCWITAKVRVEYVDSPAMTLYGFPLVWHRRDLAASLAFIADPVGLLIDLLFYLLVVLIALSLLGRTRRVRAGVLLGSILWLSAAASSAAVALPYMMGYSRWEGLELDGKVVAYELHLGPDYSHE